MKKAAILFLTIIFLNQLAQAQPDLIPYRVGDKWGYCDTLMNVIIPVQFDEAWAFGNDFANVKINQVQKRIDKKGNISDNEQENDEVFTIVDRKTEIANLPSSYETDYPFFEYGFGLVLVRNKETKLYGYLNKKYDEIIPCTYENAKRFDGTEVEKFATVSLKNKWGLIDSSGQKVVPCIYDRPLKYDYKERRHQYVVKNKKWGLLNENHELIVKPKFDSIYQYRFFRDISDDNQKKYVVKKNNVWGLINDQSKTLIPIKYDQFKISEIPDFTTGFGFIIAQKDEKWGVLYLNNDVFLDFNYEEIKSEPQNKNQDIAFIAKFDGYWGLVGKNNTVYLDFKYDEVVSYGAESVNFRCGDIWGLYDLRKKILITCKYDKKFYGFYDGLTRVIYQGKPGYIDIKGREYWKD